MAENNPLSYLRKESLDIFNRLHSIEEDIAFVQQVHEAYSSLPLLPNLRCGAWYMNPTIATNVLAYFKSTDGHFSNWSFNLRRSNLHLLPLIVERGGIILVDSTRSGKRIPDALSKTVPIWCAVINRAMLLRYAESYRNEPISCDTNLYTPPGAVSAQEHRQIEHRLDGWAQSLAASSFTLPILSRPLRPLWVTPATSSFPVLQADGSATSSAFLPVICVSASKRVDQGVERRSGGFAYVQGSGDDHELWGMGLTPELFWEHHIELLAAERPRIPTVISRIISEKTAAGESPKEGRLEPPTPIIPVNGQLLITTLSNLPTHPCTVSKAGKVAYILLVSNTMQNAYPKSEGACLYIPEISGKKGQTHFLKTILPITMHFMQERLTKAEIVCVASESGKDQSIGVVLAALQLFFADDGTFSTLTRHSTTDKQSIRTRLEWIIASRPEANPSRSTLKRVNEFLLSPSFLGK